MIESRNEIRSTKPPEGGIFLHANLDIPDYVLRLIDEEQDIRLSSPIAGMATEFLYDRAKAQKYRLFTDDVTRPETGGEWAKCAHETLRSVEALRYHAGGTIDMVSTISRHATKLASYLIEHISTGIQIGPDTYMVITDPGGKKYLATCVAGSPVLTIFNYWQNMPPLTKPADFCDQAQLICTIALERKKLGIRGYRPERETYSVTPNLERELKEENRKLAVQTYAFSQSFWLSNDDIMPEKYGQILQLAHDADGRVVKTDSSHAVRVQSLAFDARSFEARGGFHWQYSETDCRTKRQILKTYESYPTMQGVVEQEFDSQLRQTRRTYQAFQPISDILELASHPEAERHMEKVRTGRLAYKKILGDYALKAASGEQIVPSSGRGSSSEQMKHFRTVSLTQLWRNVGPLRLPRTNQ